MYTGIIPTIGSLDIQYSIFSYTIILKGTAFSVANLSHSLSCYFWQIAPYYVFLKYVNSFVIHLVTFTCNKL